MPSKRSKSRNSRRKYIKRRSASRKSYKKSYSTSRRRSVSRRRSPKRKSASRKRSGSRKSRKIGYVKVSAANPCSMLTSVNSCGGNPNCNWTKRGCVRRSGYAKGTTAYAGPMLPPSMPALLSSAPTTCYRF